MLSLPFSVPCRARLGAAIAVAACCFLLISRLSSQGQTQTQLPAATGVLTNIDEIWTIPHEHADEEYRIKTEVVIYYLDTEWGNASGECLGVRHWLPIFDSPYRLHAGQRIAIDGVIVPQRERFVWSKTKVRILDENVPLVAETVPDLGKNPAALRDHLISVEGLVDSELDEATHCTMDFLCGDTRARVFVLKATNGPPVRFKTGDFVRLKCVYSPQFDKDGNLSDLALWVNSPVDVVPIGSLATDSRFNLPITESKDIQWDTPLGTLVRVEGTVRKYEPGHWVTIWDRTGQIMIQSKQSQPLRFGDQVEAIGYPYNSDLNKCLLNALYRLEPSTGGAPAATNALPLPLAEQIRDLTPEEAGRRLPVSLRGVVTWSHASTPFAYVQDASGGIRVVNPKWDTPGTMKPGTIVLVDGVTSDGDFVPVVTNAVVRRNGWWNLSGERFITLEQALTGAEEGHWVKMRGFVRSVTETNGLACFNLSTSSGEFRAWTPASQSFAGLIGSIIDVTGVCSAIVNTRHQLTGIEIWAPDLKYIETEAPAPADPFSVPLRPLSSLRRFNVESALNQRVRTAGTVVLHVPGHYLDVQAGADSLFALSQQTDSLRPGDRVEVVGFPGEEGRKFVLREAVYRRISGGAEPKPADLSASNSVDLNLDGLLAKTDGTLLNQVEKNGERRLLIRGKNLTFEASLTLPANEKPASWDPALGSEIAVTGVYEVQNDEYGNPRSFLFHLRSPNDVEVLQQPPWWNLARLLWVTGAVLLVFLIAVVWGVLIARSNRLLHHAQAELQAANDQLENRVQQRTRELQDQVTAKEQAHIELAQTQRDLMLASRQAGMAEMATGVLHNVGNVLNSVNVSATLVRDQIRQSATHSLVKATDLLKEKHGELGAFLTQDARGKLVPDFIVQVAEQLRREQESTLSELNQLTKNIDHIKDVVAMQQSYARVAGVLEKVSLADLVEDALQINSAALNRHDVKVIRQFESVPPVTVDKHKVLQILINLIRNAKYALDEGKPREKRLVITIAGSGEDKVMIRIEDNGIGIPAENMTRIFSHGFTTRPAGHGFGLHIGALNAKEMSGSLSAASAGTGCGATFTLILPCSPPA